MIRPPRPPLPVGHLIALGLAALLLLGIGVLIVYGVVAAFYRYPFRVGVFLVALVFFGWLEVRKLRRSS